ncbi:hypothetical protein LguiA_015753 [Lonicera macranthoides]
MIGRWLLISESPVSRYLDLFAALRLKKSAFCIAHIYVPRVLMAFQKKNSLVDGPICSLCEEELNFFQL